MLRNPGNCEKVSGDISLITSVTFINLSRCYIKYAVSFKNLLVALVNDFPSSTKKFQLRCKHNIVFVIVTTYHYK